MAPVWDARHQDIHRQPRHLCQSNYGQMREFIDYKTSMTTSNAAGQQWSNSGQIVVK